ncbi:kinase-like protein [Peniophora sp. CONT]|nr:kinase-like protein [Peniophora sp. CONT]
MVSPWYTFPLSDYIRELNQKQKLSGELYHLKDKMYILDFEFYAAELLLAMEELQKCNIVHLDIKADNVFVTPTGHLVLGDFDLSIPDISAGKGKGTLYNNVPLNHACGTPAYMAPELLEWASNRPRRGVDLPCPTQRADMWSLGMTLLQLALRLGEPYFEMLAPELFTSTDFHARTSALHEYLSYVWSMSGEERGEGGEKMARQLKKQLNIQVYNFLCGLLEMDPTKRTTIEEAKNDYLFCCRWTERERGEHLTPPFAKRLGPPKRATVFAGPECAELHLQPGQSAVKKTEADKTIPFYTYGLDWISPKILQGDKSSGQEHGVVDYYQAPMLRA